MISQKTKESMDKFKNPVEKPLHGLTTKNYLLE